MNAGELENLVNNLNSIQKCLDQHRLKMEEAEKQPLPQYKPDIRVSEGALRRAREINEPNKRIEAIEKRLDEMPARFRKDMTAHFYDQTKRIKAIEEQNSQLDGRLNCHKRWVDADCKRINATEKRLTEIERVAKPAPPSNAKLREGARRTGNGPPESWWKATDDPFQPVDWQRYHDLLDKISERQLTDAEEAEYRQFVPIITELDATEGKAADEGLDNLAKEHERVVASIRRLTAAVRAAAAEDAKPAPPIEVEMRTQHISSNVVSYCVWNYKLAGNWFAEIGLCGEVRYTSAQFAQEHGDRWLAALSEQLGVPLVAKWVEDA